MLIGISGIAGSGKDSAANFLVELGFCKISFADPIKRIAQDIFDFSEQQLWGASQYRNEPDKRYLRSVTITKGRAVGPSMLGPEPANYDYLAPRLVLQKIGTEVGRECYPNVWIEYGLKAAKKILECPQDLIYDKTRGVLPSKTKDIIKGVVIPDCRFLNEIDAIHNLDGLVIRITRPYSGLKGTTHPSEVEQLSIPDDKFDHIIVNDGSLDDLKEKVIVLFNKLMKIPEAPEEDQLRFDWENSNSLANKGSIALDFDGVINSYESGFVAIDNIPDPPVPGAFKFIKKLLRKGFKVYIYSTRNGDPKGKEAILSWMKKYGMKKKVLSQIELAEGKPIAKLYIDDRAWQFTGTWPSIDELENFKPWHGGKSSSQK